MTVNPADAVPTPLSGMTTREAPQSPEANSELGQDAFLKLLVAQLKYQDPLNPADGAEFLAQTAQFTMVEKLADLEAQGQSTVTSQQQMQAAQLVGRQVTYVDATGNLVEGVVESAEYTPDGQSLTIDGQAVELDNITKVVGNNRVDGASEAVSALGPSLASSLTPALVEAIQEASAGTADSDAGVDSAAEVSSDGDREAESTSTDALADET
ncbi:MAG: flagellar hook assembly protein FlgD, partial [Actinomycetes bacterium]